MTPITSTTTTTTDVLPLRAGRWAVDDSHATVGFGVRHLGVSKVRGRFGRFDAEVVIGETLADTSVVATVDLASIDTGNADRDIHARSGDLLDVERRPTMAFRSSVVEAGAGGEGWTIRGELTIGDVTRPFDLTVDLGGVEAFVDGTRHAGFEARGQLRRSDFGIAPSIPAAMIGDVVTVELDLELLEPTGDPVG